MAIVKFEGKAIKKLIETVSAGIGTLYKPRAMRKEAEAEAYKIELLAEANARASLLKADNELEIIERAKNRLVYQEVNRQINLENVAEKSIEYLGENVSEKQVNEDWRARFFSKVQDVSVDEMQEVWAKILAEEITKPGAISLRTLDIVSNLTKEEAEIFQRAAKLAFNSCVIYQFGYNEYGNLEKFGIKYADILTLRTANLLFDTKMGMLHEYIDKIMGSKLLFGNKLFKVSRGNERGCRFYGIGFTPAGTELINVLKIEPDYDYLNEFINEQKKHGFQFEEIPIEKLNEINQ